MDQRIMKVDDDTRKIHPRDDIEDMCEEKKEKEDPPTLKKAWMHQFEILNITLKRGKKG